MLQITGHSKTLVNFQQTKRHHIQENTRLHIHKYEVKSHSLALLLQACLPSVAGPSPLQQQHSSQLEQVLFLHRQSEDWEIQVFWEVTWYDW